MNPLLQEALASIVRSILKLGAGYLVARGVWTQGDATTYVSAAALAMIGFGWSYWTTYSSRIKLLAALTMPAGATENQVIAKVASGAITPIVSTPADTIPGVPKP